MPRLHKPTGPDLRPLVAAFVREVEDYIRQDVDVRLAKAAGSLHGRRGAGLAKLCPVPGCGKPAAGQKYRWRCREHKLWNRPEGKAERPFLAVPLPVPREATAIPEGVTIKRLPPGPMPGSRNRPLPNTRCRLPGCTVKHSGPRFDFFCRDHYAQLSPDERKRYRELSAASVRRPSAAGAPGGAVVVRSPRAAASAQEPAAPAPIRWNPEPAGSAAAPPVAADAAQDGKAPDSAAAQGD